MFEHILHQICFPKEGNNAIHHNVKEHCQQDCSDPRDKVYSVLGMAPPALRKQLKPDYSKTPCDAFMAAMVAEMNMIRRLNTLTLVDHRRCAHTESLPSWVADLQIVARAKLSCAIWRPKPEPQFAFSKDLRNLHSRVRMIDTILEVKIQGTSVPFQQLVPTPPVEWTWDLNKIIDQLVDEGGIRASETTGTNAREDLR